MSPAVAPISERIDTAAVTLSPLGGAHAERLFPLLDDWQVVRMLAQVPWPLTLADVQGYAGRQVGPEAESEDFAIMAAGEPVGVCSVKFPGTGDPPRRMPRLGYWIGRRYWGRGYASAAVAMLVEHSFRRFTTDVIGAGVFEDNPASRRVVEKFGFEATGSYDTPSLSRGAPVPTTDMHLLRARWAALGGAGA